MRLRSRIDEGRSQVNEDRRHNVVRERIPAQMQQDLPMRCRVRQNQPANNAELRLVSAAEGHGNCKVCNVLNLLRERDATVPISIRIRDATAAPR